MDWGFLDIFKKADFNKLMLSVAVTAWILFFLFSKHIYIIAGAILSSAYCVISLVVYIYQYFSAKIEDNHYAAKKKKEDELYAAKKVEEDSIEITRMFEGLMVEKKNMLAKLLINGKKDSFNTYVLLIQKNKEEYLHAKQAHQLTYITSKDYYNKKLYLTSITEYADSISISIHPHLYDLIKQYINENQITSELTNE